jgi:template-activating factor I
LPEELKKVILTNRKHEEDIEEITEKYDLEIKKLETNYDKLIMEKLKSRNEIIKKIKNYWLTALSNHRILKEYISTSDIDVLRYLEDVSYEKIYDVPENYVSDIIFEY